MKVHHGPCARFLLGKRVYTICVHHRGVEHPPEKRVPPLHRHLGTTCRRPERTVLIHSTHELVIVGRNSRIATVRDPKFFNSFFYIRHERRPTSRLWRTTIQYTPNLNQRTGPIAILSLSDKSNLRACRASVFFACVN